MNCMVQMTATNLDVLEICYGGFIEYTKHDTRESTSFWWDEMDLSKHGEIASWPIWKESWITFEAMVATFKRYESYGDNHLTLCSCR